MHVTKLERGLIGKYFTQIYIWRTFPSLLPEGSGTVRPSWNLGFIVFSRSFWIWSNIRLTPVCRRPTLSRNQGRIRRSPIHSGYAQGSHTRIRSCQHHYYLNSTGLQCLLKFTSDNCWGSSYPSSRRHRRSTHGDEGNSGGGGIGGGTICISGTWSQSQTENQKSKFFVKISH